MHPSTTPIAYAISHRHVVTSHGPKVVEDYINKLGPLAAPKRRRRIELGIEDEDARASLAVWDRFLIDMEAWMKELMQEKGVEAAPRARAILAGTA